MKKEIVYVYENLLKRIQAGDSILDEMRWKSFANLSTEIIVITTNDTKNTAIEFTFCRTKSDYFNISDSYYESEEVLNFYNQVILFISEYQRDCKMSKGISRNNCAFRAGIKYLLNCKTQ